jgi:HAD superfamily hydrolase (TIGR01549 family)
MNVKTTTVLLDAGGVILDESEQEKIIAEIIVELLSRTNSGYSGLKYQDDIEEAVQSFSPKTYQFVLWKHFKGDQLAFNEHYDLFFEKWLSLKPPLQLSRGFEIEIKNISKHLQVGIAGQYGREILDLLERESLLDCFAYKFTQDDFSITKPDPRYYEQIADACGVDPKECIMVGDRIDKDIVPAKQLSMKTVLVRAGIHKNQQPRIPTEIPDAELESVSGLAEVVLTVAKKI